MKKYVWVIGILLFIIYNQASANWVLQFKWLADTFVDNIHLIRYYNGPDQAPQKGWGLFLFEGTKVLDSEKEIILDNNKLYCKEKLKGWYLNLFRGNYVINIDESNDYGLYTNCNKGFDNAVIGYVYKDLGNGYELKLYVGFKMDLVNNKLIFNRGFQKTFILKNGVIPVGLIYDNIGGVGFVGGDITSTGVSNLQSLLNNTDFDKDIKIIGDKISIKGKEFDRGFSSLVKSFVSIVGNVSVLNLKDKQIINRSLTNIKDITGRTKLGSIAGQVSSYSEVVNFIRKNIELICRGRWEEVDSNIEYNFNNRLTDIVCLDSQGNNVDIKISYDPTQYGNRYVLIVKGGVNKIIFTKSLEGPGYIEVYNDKGYILVDNAINLVEINGQGEVDYTNYVTSGAILRGNFIVRGLIGGYDGVNITGFKHKLYIHGSLVVLNTIGSPSQKRVDYLQELLSNDSISNDNIDLLRVFKWRCLAEGKGTDGVNCGDINDKWYLNSLIIIKKYYKSLLLNKNF